MTLNVASLKAEVVTQVSTILASDFKLDITETSSVPHSIDNAITFPNLDDKSQRVKLIETTVLYVDMRRSTQLNLQHRQTTVAKLYSAFVRAITLCVNEAGGEVRGIIGDRVMVLFDPKNCFETAVNTAMLINSVCTFVIDKYFTHNEVKFGIGIDHGRMLATKTGLRRQGINQQSYRSLVWLGRPANVASKLTDNANKPSDTTDLVMLRVAYRNGASIFYVEEYPHVFVQQFAFDIATGLMRHHDPRFHSFTTFTKVAEIKPPTPAILMTEKVYQGFRTSQPESAPIKGGWLKRLPLEIPEYNGTIYGFDGYYRVFENT